MEQILKDLEEEVENLKESTIVESNDDLIKRLTHLIKVFSQEGNRVWSDNETNIKFKKLLKEYDLLPIWAQALRSADQTNRVNDNPVLMMKFILDVQRQLQNILDEIQKSSKSSNPSLEEMESAISKLVKGARPMPGSPTYASWVKRQYDYFSSQGKI